MDWIKTLEALAPTVATALLGPLGGGAVSAIGALFGISDATQDKIATAIKSATMTPEQIMGLKQLELDYQAKEKELGFKYAELSFKDRDSARKANVEGGLQGRIFVMSCILLIIGMSTEAFVLFYGVPQHIDDLITGRVLGMLDSVILLILTYYYGKSAPESPTLPTPPAVH
jgi:hypothetical protein